MTQTSQPSPDQTPEEAPEQALARFHAIYDALRSRRGRPPVLQAAFCAASLVGAKGEASALADAAATERDALNAALSGFRAPSGSMRWIYGAILASREAKASDLIATIEALKSARKAKRGPSLYAGGSRAALVLTAARQTDATTLQRFIDLKDGLTPPWWRRNDAITDTFAAGHAAAGDALADIQARRAQVEEILRADRKARAHARDGARTAVLLGRDGRSVLDSFHAMEDGRRADRYVRGRTSRAMAMDWAALGLDREDGAAMSHIAQGLPRAIGSTGYARMRVAQMIRTASKPELATASAASAAAALAAVIAAQTAVIVAATSASTVAATSTAAS